MTWVKIDDGFDEHPKIESLTDPAFRLHIAGLCYAARTLSDGFIPTGKATRLTDTAKARHLTELVDTGIWIPTDGGYLIHDYLDYQRSRSDVLAEREATRTRVQRHRERTRNGVTNADSNGDGTPAPSRPDPSTELSSSSSTTTPVDNPEEDERVTQAIKAVAQRRLRNASGVRRPSAWLAATEHDLRTSEDAAHRAALLIADYPQLTDGQLIDALDGNTSVLRFLERQEHVS